MVIFCFRPPDNENNSIQLCPVVPLLLYSVYVFLTPLVSLSFESLVVPYTVMVSLSARQYYPGLTTGGGCPPRRRHDTSWDDQRCESIPLLGVSVSLEEGQETYRSNSLSRSSCPFIGSLFFFSRPSVHRFSVRCDSTVYTRYKGPVLGDGPTVRRSSRTRSGERSSLWRNLRTIK